MAYGAVLGQKTNIPEPVNVIETGNMNGVTSNAVAEAIAAIPEGAQVVTGSYVGTGTDTVTLSGLRNARLIIIVGSNYTTIVPLFDGFYYTFCGMCFYVGAQSQSAYHGFSASVSSETVTIKPRIISGLFSL